MPKAPGEVWFVRFPFEEDPTQFKARPVIVMESSAGRVFVLSLMVTTHAPRDRFDVLLSDYSAAGLHKPSVVRTSRSMEIRVEDFLHYIGTLTDRDFLRVSDTFTAFLES
jgi:mRNA interferase MazF